METEKLTEDQLSLVKELYQVLLINHVPLGEYLDTVYDFMNRYIKEYKLKPLPPDPEERDSKPVIEDVTEEEGEEEEYK